MIEDKGNGQLELSFEDWTDDMKILSVRLSKLPKQHQKHDRMHDLGIDRLSHYKYGKLVIQLLADHVEELTHRPDDREVLALGQALMRICLDIHDVQRTYGVDRAMQRRKVRTLAEVELVRRRMQTAARITAAIAANRALADRLSQPQAKKVVMRRGN